MNKNIVYTLTTTVLFILLANLWAYREAKRMHLLSSIPTGLIDGYIANMKKDYDIWLVGNSTLANGVNTDQVEKGTGLKVLKTPMGSATGEAMCLLAIEGIKSIKKMPADLFLFVTKDDFNLKGLRGETSKNYIKSMEGKALKEQILSAIPLYSYRISLKQKYGKILREFFVSGKKKEKTGKLSQSDTLKMKEELINETHSAHLINLGKNFTLNLKGFKQLAQLCNEKNIRLHVIFPPVTRSVPNWQNFYYPAQNYTMVMNTIKTELKNDNIPYIDYLDSVPSTTRYFKDEYHLNKNGANMFTKMLVTHIGSTLPKGK